MDVPTRRARRRARASRDEEMDASRDVTPHIARRRDRNAANRRAVKNKSPSCRARARD
jgi:hypothetical protein